MMSVGHSKFFGVENAADHRAARSPARQANCRMAARPRAGTFRPGHGLPRLPIATSVSKPVPLRVGLRARLRPMKLPSFLLVGSLVANAVLLTWWLAPDRASPALTAHNSSTRAPATAAPSLTPRAAPSALTPAALREHLTSLGLPPAAVTALVRARLYAPHDARRRELLTAASQSLPWWKFAKRPPTYDSSIHLTPAARKELHDLEAEARAATLATLGPVPLDPTGSIAARYAFLSPEKAVLLDALEQDYRNLNSELRDELGRVRTTADREREKLLETERQRDLAVLLSPAEREILDQRTSPTATRLASRMLAFQATEEEYRVIYAIQKSFEQTSALAANPAHGSRVPSIDSQPEFTKQIRAALGETRFADWESSTQTHVQALAQLAVVNNLPPRQSAKSTPSSPPPPRPHGRSSPTTPAQQSNAPPPSHNSPPIPAPTSPPSSARTSPKNICGTFSGSISWPTAGASN